MANLSGQSLDESGLTLTPLSGTQFSITSQQCKDLLLSLGNITLVDTQIKSMAVATLGADTISADQIQLTYNPDGTIAGLFIGQPR